jgi:hypothetical protein
LYAAGWAAIFSLKADGYFVILIHESFEEPLKNGSQAANQMFSAIPEMTLTV